MYSDNHGQPPLVADHFAPVAPDYRYGVDSQSVIRERLQQGINQFLGTDVNALDYYGFWKLLDGVLDTTFYGKDREYAFGNTPQERFMGLWSDGVPVKQLAPTETP